MKTKAKSKAKRSDKELRAELRHQVDLTRHYRDMYYKAANERLVQSRRVKDYHMAWVGYKVGTLPVLQFYQQMEELNLLNVWRNA